MRAGLLRHPIAIFQPGVTRDTLGQNIAGGATFLLNARASINGLSGKEVYVLGAGFSGQVTHKIVIRYPSAPITSGMMVKFRDRQFLVQYTQDPDEMRRELDLICLEQSVSGVTA